MEFKPNGAVGKAVPKQNTQPAQTEKQMFVPKLIKRSNEIDTTFEVGQIAAWSFSSLQSFEQCPRKVAFRQVDKIPEPSSPAAERGSEIHNLAERYVRGEEGEEVPLPLQKFKKGFEALKAAFEAGKVTCEESGRSQKTGRRPVGATKIVGIAQNWTRSSSRVTVLRLLSTIKQVKSSVTN